MKKNKRALVKKYGKDAEQVMYGRATNIAKKQAESMNQDKLREMVRTALQGPVTEKKGKDMDGDGDVDSQDYLAARDAAIKKNLKEDWGSSDQSAMNQSIHRDLGNPTDFPGLTQIMRAAEDAVDFYWDDWDEYQTDREGLIMHAAQMYANKMFPEFMAGMRRMMEPVDENLGITRGTMTKINNAVKKAPDMAKALLSFYDDVKEKEQVDFEKNQKMSIVLSKLRDLAASSEEEEVNESLTESTELYNNNGFNFTRFYGGKENGPSLQITTDARDYITIPGSKLGLFMSGLEKAVSVFDDMSRQLPIDEDFDLGHEDNEPHMLKADLYRIGKYAMELYQMVDKFEESSEEVDFPHWWQSKVIKAKDALVGAKHYLDFEVKEPQIDAMVDVAQEEDVIDENALGMTDSRLSSKQHSDLDYAVRDDKRYTFGKDPYADDQLRYEYAKKMGFLEEKKEVNEGTWSVGSSKDIKSVMDALDQMMYLKNPKDIIRYLSKLDKFLYNTVGDDIFHDDIDGAKREAAEGNMDRAQNRLADAYGRAEFFLERQMDREGIKEEAVNTRHIEDNEYMAAKIQKAMNGLDKSSEDYESKLYRLQQARKANNKGDFKMAMKIMTPFLAPVEEGKVCESCGKMHEGSCSSSIAEKLAKQLKSK